MRKIVLCIGLVAACGGDVDYLGMSPEDAANELADEGCRNVFRCGIVQVDDTTSPCTATYAPAETQWASQAACEAEVRPLYVDLLEGCAAANLSDAEREDFNDCFNYDPGCYSEAELADLAAASCTGAPFGPESCQRASDVLSRCFTCANDPTDPSCG